jgi:hypothetical protein
MDSRPQMEPVLKLVMDTIMGSWDCLLSKMMDKIDAIQEETKLVLSANQERMGAGQEQMGAKIRVNQAKSPVRKYGNRNKHRPGKDGGCD